MAKGIYCCYCTANFLNLALLREHMQSEHSNDEYCERVKRSHIAALCCKMDITDLKCKLCEQNCDLLSSLKEHLIKKHDVKFLPEEKRYISEFKLSDSEVMNCAVCNAPYETFKTLLIHMNGHYRNFICKVCDMGFMNENRFKVHRKTHLNGIFECTLCSKVFSTHVKKMRHENVFHKNVARANCRKCPFCVKTFTSYYLKNKHLNEDHNSAGVAYKCNICDKSFLLKLLLTKHIRSVHLMERNHKCSECDQVFFTKQLLEDHMIRHNGERIHKCTECNKAYARKKTLKEHMRIHNNDRRFTCELCGLAFVQNCSRKGHMMSKHGVTLAEVEEAKLAPEGLMKIKAKLDAADYSESCSE